MAGNGTGQRLVKNYCTEVLGVAAANGIDEEELPLIINGCSGGLSWFYRMAFNREISCIDCCDVHDLLYHLGGTSNDRKAADILLRKCSMQPGYYSTDWRVLPRRFWRWIRGWIMYAAVRLFGSRHFALYRD